ncbi:unnamed protein product [Ambrosiozyma monospora]|uniref:Unnamed protein product n=2 Tax=Ambrosiozyma monospora TaxID=43982 RepID=A0ACB5TXV6_AMBMO|nr:unnamed protein product [Ambrosiozyma monospora]
MELLILISACKGGSAAKITAVIPEFPYSKQSKMKKHRGAITARMLANLLIMAGADHVVSMDLHASQMQGFFSKPVDNLYAAPTLAKWIRLNIENYQDSVIVSKNPGGTKRVTSLADQLKVNFAMIHTDRRRTKDAYSAKKAKKMKQLQLEQLHSQSVKMSTTEDGEVEEEDVIVSSDIQTARIVQGHVVDDQVPDSNSRRPSRPSLPHKQSDINYDNENSDDEDEPEFNASEKLITLVGNVQGRAAILLDDMIDKHATFIAAAEHLRLNCGAKQCYVVATHGIFSNDCLERLEECKYIDGIIVTNTYPIPEEKLKLCKKLTVIDVSPIFAECIRRDHFGESISVLFDSLAVIA